MSPCKIRPEIRALALFLLMPGWLSADPIEAVESSIDSLCEWRNPDDEEARRHCIQEHRLAYNEVHAWMLAHDMIGVEAGKHDNAQQKLYRRCLDTWAPNYKSVAYCLSEGADTAALIGGLPTSNCSTGNCVKEVHVVLYDKRSPSQARRDRLLARRHHICD